MAHFFIHLGALGLFLLGIVDGLLFAPFGIDVLLIVMVARNPGMLMLYVLCAASGSAVGYSVVDAISRKGGEEGLRKKLGERKFEKMKHKMEKRGTLAVGLAALMPPPFPFTPVLAAASAFQNPRKTLLPVLFRGPHSPLSHRGTPRSPLRTAADPDHRIPGVPLFCDRARGGVHRGKCGGHHSLATVGTRPQDRTGNGPGRRLRKGNRELRPRGDIMIAMRFAGLLLVLSTALNAQAGRPTLPGEDWVSYLTERTCPVGPRSATRSGRSKTEPYTACNYKGLRVPSNREELPRFSSLVEVQVRGRRK